jgi:hypothetical protein
MLLVAFLCLVTCVYADISHSRVGTWHTVKFVNAEAYEPVKGISYGRYSCVNVSDCPLENLVVCTSDYFWKWSCLGTFPGDRVFDSVVIRCGDHTERTFVHEACRLEYTVRPKYLEEKLFEVLFTYAMEWAVNYLVRIFWTLTAIIILSFCVISWCFPSDRLQ